MKVYDHADLRGQTVELTDPENTQFNGCDFGTAEEENQATISTHGLGYEIFSYGGSGQPIIVEP